MVLQPYPAPGSYKENTFDNWLCREYTISFVNLLCVHLFFSQTWCLHMGPIFQEGYSSFSELGIHILLPFAYEWSKPQPSLAMF